jgi:transposase
MEDTAKFLVADVSKAELVMYDGAIRLTIPNCRQEIEAVLRKHRGAIVVCEPTSTYHLELAVTAHNKGHTVCLVNPKEVRHYRESRSFRAKTDKIDAFALYEFAIRHPGSMRPWEPPSAELELLRKLMGKRAKAIKARTELAQVFGDDERWNEAQEALSSLVDRLSEEIAQLASSYESYERVLSLPGVGPCTAAALTYLLNVHDFEHAGAVVAFTGMDLRVRDSGAYCGLRRLTKRGDPLFRHLLYMAGRSLLRTRHGRSAKVALAAKGRHHTEQAIIAGRKLLRVAFALHQSKSTFDPQKWQWLT